jgi:DNA replication and repair protein RecF
MYLEQLSVLNFKNHLESKLSFTDNVNCFVGDNGSGKTNLLDAIHYLSFTKSFFTKQDAFNIYNDQPFLSIEGIFEKEDKKNVVHIGVKSGVKKVVKRDKKNYDRMADHIGLYPLVMVSPTDTELLKGGSDLRRKYMDSVISQFNREYLEALIKYAKLLAQRNAMLKQMFRTSNFNASSLELYDEQIQPIAHFIHQTRKEFVSQLTPIFLKYYQQISNNDEDVSIVYQSQLEDQNYLELCKSSIEKDRFSQFSSVGIHKDDLFFGLSNYPVRKRGSQGQQKTFVLSLKLAQFDFMKTTLKFKPMLLLDDIFDKLDDSRVEHLMKLVGNHHFGQIFVTDTHPQRSADIFNQIEADFKLFHIKNGSVEKEV